MSKRHQEAVEFIERMVPQLMEEAKVPGLRMRRKMRLLEGRYEIYRGLSKADVVNRGASST